MFAEDISEDFSDITFTGFECISGYLRNLRGRLLSSEKVSEVFTHWVFTLKPFPVLMGLFRRLVLYHGGSARKQPISNIPP